MKYKIFFKRFTCLLSVLLMSGILILIACDKSGNSTSSDNNNINTTENGDTDLSGTDNPIDEPIDNPSPDSKVIIINNDSLRAFDSIPDVYIVEVKKMLFNLVGESHAKAYIYGLKDLMADTGGTSSKYQVKYTYYGEPDAPTTSALRITRSYRNSINTDWLKSAGETNFWTNESGITAMKNHLTYMREQGNPVKVFGFGWCWDMTWHNDPGGSIDPVYNVRWAGSSVGSPSGDKPWGLDDADNSLTGNTVNMTTYLKTVDAYNQHETGTITIFTTGPVDNLYEDYSASENGYQRYLKNQFIRKYVTSSSEVRILFDFADILSYGNAGSQQIAAGWTDSKGTHHTFPITHPDNAGVYNGGNGDCHVTRDGCIKLGKAIWYMLARVAGWDGKSGK